MTKGSRSGAWRSRFRAWRGVLRSVGTVAFLVVASGALTRGADAAVSIVDFAFEPATITIDAGATVTWTVTRAQDPHTVSPVDPPDAFVGSPLLRQGDHFSVTFAQAGTYRYQCTIHPEEMQGTVIVKAAVSTTTPGASTATPGASTITAPPPSGTPTPTSSPPSQQPTGDGSPPIAVIVAVLAAAGVAGWFVIRRRTNR